MDRAFLDAGFDLEAATLVLRGVREVRGDSNRPIFFEDA
jgi:hypothetical protein